MMAASSVPIVYYNAHNKIHAIIQLLPNPFIAFLSTLASASASKLPAGTTVGWPLSYIYILYGIYISTYMLIKVYAYQGVCLS